MSRLVIEAGKTERHYWADLWKYRELFVFLSWRDILVRYKQTVIGVLWAVIRPVLSSLILAFVFGYLGKMSTGGYPPYILVVFSAMLPWLFFSSALSEASNSLITNANMISKIYFPRLVVPASAIMVALVDFLISLVVLLGMMCWYHVWPTWRFLAIIPFTGLAFAAVLGAGLLLAALNVEYRDFRHALPFIIQVGMYISPVGYLSSRVPEEYRLAYFLNPMAGVIEGFRWAVLGTPVDWTCLGVSCAVILLFVFIGVRYFRKTERAFADVI